MAVDGADVWQGQEWTLFYNQEDTFESGDAGAEAAVSFTLNNRGHAVYGLRFSVRYTIPVELESLNVGGAYPNLSIRREWRVGGLDKAFTATITLSQSNASSSPSPVDNIDSPDGTVRMYWPVPLRLRGGNNIRVEMRRDLSYPTLTFGDPAQVFQPTPTVKVTLVTGQYLTDQYPAGPPGSTGIYP